MISIRPFDFSDADYEAMVAILNVVWPDTPASIYFEKRQDQFDLIDPGLVFQRVMAELDDVTGHCVGHGQFMQKPWAFHEQKFAIFIHVDPDFAGQGIDDALFNHLWTALEPYNPLSLESGSREDNRPVIDFLERHGFQLRLRQPVSELDPAQFDAGRFTAVMERVASHGITIKSYRELEESDPAFKKKLYSLERQIAKAVPWYEADEFSFPPYERWALSYEDNPDLLPDAILVALAGENFVGLTSLWASQATDRLLYTALTGVRASHRRLGIATALKVRAITAVQGIRASHGRPPLIRTDNEENNPMFQINLFLGFVEAPAWVIYEKEIGKGHQL